MSSRLEMINSFYDEYDEDGRLEKTVHGRLEYFVTMDYIRRFASCGAKVLEVGAGTGRYSVALAKEGMDVTAVEPAKKNLEILKEKCEGIKGIRPLWGDATDLGELADDSFDLTLVFGPMYHLYEPQEVNRAIDEAIRVTKPGGTMMFAFISVFAIMYSNYLFGNWASGQKQNFTEDYKNLHFEQQLFTGYDVEEFESLFKTKPVEHITTAGVDGLLEPIEQRDDFAIPDEDFDSFAAWHLHFAEKRELLGSTNHLLYICRKK